MRIALIDDPLSARNTCAERRSRGVPGAGVRLFRMSVRSGWVSHRPAMSKKTPSSADVKWNPLPVVSMMMGDAYWQVQSSTQNWRNSHRSGSSQQPPQDCADTVGASDSRTHKAISDEAIRYCARPDLARWSGQWLSISGSLFVRLLRVKTTAYH